MHRQSSLVVASQLHFTTQHRDYLLEKIVARVTRFGIESSMTLLVRAIFTWDPFHAEGNDIERSVTIKSLLSHLTILRMNL